MWNPLKRVPYWYLIAIPLLLTFMGAASNQAVLIANGDTFPVMVNPVAKAAHCRSTEMADIIKAITQVAPPTIVEKPKALRAQPAPIACGAGGEYLDDVHVVMNSQSRLKFMADVFDMHDGIYSIGDFALILGDWIWSWSVFAWLVLAVRKLIEG